MKLERLLENIEYSVLSGSVDIEINKVNYDSRKVEKGDLFVCIKGFASDGHKYASQAKDKGATVIVCENDIDVDLDDIPRSRREYRER